MAEDIVGQQTLKILSQADNYIRLSTAELQQHLSGKVLELGAGNGNLTQHLAFQNEITALDINPHYLNDLENKIHQLEVLKSQKAKKFQTMQADLMGKPNDEFLNSFDTLLSCQVLEHLADDEGVIKNYVACLKPGGKVVLQLPAHQFAYSDLDKNLGHYRRYTRHSAEKLLKNVGLKIIKSYYFNFFGLLGWLWAGRILKKQILPEKEMSFFNLIAPYVLKLDLIFSKILGLNVIVIATKI